MVQEEGKGAPVTSSQPLGVVPSKRISQDCALATEAIRRPMANFMARSREKNGAGDEIRTRDINLGKVALYQLSYSRSARQPSVSHAAAGLSRCSGPAVCRGGGEAEEVLVVMTERYTALGAGEIGIFPERYARGWAKGARGPPDVVGILNLGEKNRVVTK
jgi:hypothetical protein